MVLTLKQLNLVKHVVYCGGKEIFFHEEGKLGRIIATHSTCEFYFTALLHEMPEIVTGIAAVDNQTLIICRFYII